MLLERALVIDVKALGPDHPTVAQTADNLAEALNTLGRKAEAKAYKQQAANIREKNKNKHDQN